MNRTVEISFHGLPLLVTGNFTEGLPATNLNPADPDEFEIIDLIIHGVRMLDDSFLNHFHDEIHNLAMEAIEDER